MSDQRAFVQSPGSWEILRHLTAAQQLPIALLTKVAGTLEDVVALFAWQMVEGLIMAPGEQGRRFDLAWQGNDRPLARGNAVLYSREEFLANLAKSDTRLWVEISSMGRWAEKQLAPARRALAVLCAFHDIPLVDLARKADCDLEILLSLDDRGLIQVMTPHRLRKRNRATDEAGRYAHAPGDARAWLRPDRAWSDEDYPVQITPKGRTYLARDGALV